MVESRPAWLICVCLGGLLTAYATPACAVGVYVNDFEASEILAYADTIPTLLNPTIPLQVNGMALDEFGKLVLATAMPGSCVIRFDPATEGLIVVADTLGPGEVAVDVYEDATSDLYVLARVPGASDSVHPRLELLPDGLPPAIPVREFTGSRDVDDIMVYPAGVRRGNVLVLTLDPGSLIELDRTGPTTFVEDRVLPMPGEPAGFSITPAGQVIVLDAITECTWSANPTRSFRSVPQQAPVCRTFPSAPTARST
ncbi:MAG: hypothetical protein JXB46_07500 [Candidatus Eisenbacteria bacterium]|nr:hypothetical protein [Candidatus Eisenbacteria bacterium]